MTYKYGEESVSRSGALSCPAKHSSTCKTFVSPILHPDTGVEMVALTEGDNIVDSGVNWGSGSIDLYGFSFTFGGGAGDWYSAPDQGAPCAVGSSDDEAKNATAQVGVSGHGASHSDTHIVHSTSPGTITPDGGAGGTWSISLTLELCFEIIGLSALGKPLDSPLYSRIRFFKRYKTHTAESPSSFSATISYGGATATISGDLLTSGEVTDAVAASVTGNGEEGFWYRGTAAGTFSVSGLGVSAGDTYSYSNGGVSLAMTGDGVTVTIPGAGGSGTATTSALPQKAVNIAGVIRAMETSYPTSLTINLTGVPGTTSTTGTGTFSASGTQKSYSFGGTAQGSAAPGLSLNTYGPVYASIDPDSLAAAGEDTRQTRLLMRGKTFAGLSLSHAASHTVDDCASLSPTGPWAGDWTAAGGTTGLALDGSGGIEWTAASGGTVTRSFDNAVTFLSYPKLRIRIKADAASKPLRVAFGGKHWDITTGATPDTYSDIDIDLSGEHSATASTSSHDTIWPLHRVAPVDEAAQVSDYLPMSEGDYFGVGRATALVFSNMDSGVTYTLDSLTLVRANAPTLDVLPAWYLGLYREVGGSGYVEGDWPTPEYPSHPHGSGGTTYYYARRGFLAACDSQQVLEIADDSYVYRQEGSGVTTVSHLPHSISSIKDEVERENEVGTLVWPGWSGTVNAPVNDASSDAEDGYYNRDLPSAFLQGGGAMYSGGSWSYGFDLALGALLAQTMYDQVDYHAGCTHWGHGPSGTIPMAAILRSGVHGKVMDEDKAPESGVTVAVEETGGGASAGSGISGADGAYQSGSPYAKGNVDHNITAQSGDNPFLSGLKLYSRKRQRAVFLVGSPVNYRPLTCDGPRQWLHVGTDKKVRTYHLGPRTAAFQSADHPVDVWAQLAFDERRSKLWLLGPDGSEFVLFDSANGGISITERLRVTADSSAVAVDSERGFTVFLYEDPSDSGKVKRRLSLDGGATWAAAATVQVGGADLTAEVLSVAQDARQGGVLLLTVNESGSTKLLRSQDGGANWSLLLS